MPNYPYKCECGKEIEMFFPLSQSHLKPECECGKEMYKDFSRINVYVDQTLGYYDDQLGKYIGSSSDKRRIMKEGGWAEATTADRESIKSKTKSKQETKEEYKQLIKETAYKNNIPLPGTS